MHHNYEESKDSSAFDKLNHLQYDLPRQVEQSEMAGDQIIDENSTAAEQADQEIGNRLKSEIKRLLLSDQFQKSASVD